MRGGVIARVLASQSPRAKEGDVVVTYAGWREVAIVNDALVEPPFPLPENAKITDLLGVLGMTGLTAYFGLEEIADVKSGDTVVVSGAAGATGSVVGQIAKIKGATVVGIAGSEDKVRWLRQDLGFDVALNYKDPDFRTKFKEATPNFINVYWDNGASSPTSPPLVGVVHGDGTGDSNFVPVGGEILDMALARAKEFARFVMCGGISQYNSASPQGPKVRTLLHRIPTGPLVNTDRALEPQQRDHDAYTVSCRRRPPPFADLSSQAARLQGFIVMDYRSRYPQAREQLAKWVAEGKLRSKETIIRGGLDAAEKALVDLFKGVNTGELHRFPVRYPVRRRRCSQ